MNVLLQQVGKKIKTVRAKKELTQEGLAERSKLHPAYIGGVERGERNLTLKSLDKIAKGLNCELRDLLERSQSKRVSTLKEKVMEEILQLLRRKDDKILQLAAALVRNVSRWKN